MLTKILFTINSLKKNYSAKTLFTILFVFLKKNIRIKNISFQLKQSTLIKKKTKQKTIFKVDCIIKCYYNCYYIFIIILTIIIFVITNKRNRTDHFGVFSCFSVVLFIFYFFVLSRTFK